MATISSNILAKATKTKKVNTKKSLITRYLDYADSKKKEGVVWYLKAIIFIPCVFMVISICAMAALTTNYVLFIGLSMVLFFTNIVVHIAGLKSRVFIPVYHATLFILTIIPLITYLNFLING